VHLPQNVIKKLTFVVFRQPTSRSSQSYRFPYQAEYHSPLSHSPLPLYHKVCLPQAWVIPRLMLERGFLPQSEVNLDKGDAFRPL